MSRVSLSSSGCPLSWSLPLTLNIDFQPTADTEDDRWPGCNPPVEPPKKAEKKGEAIEKHFLRSGWCTPHMSVRSIVGFGTVSVLLLMIFILMSDWRALFGH
jgi:hypothetical protein